MPADTLESAPLHPAIRAWFRARFGTPTEAQARAWSLIASGRDVLVCAPTGSGKTLAAFLCAIDALLREARVRGGALPDETRVLYVSPLRALVADVERNLQEPLRGIREAWRAAGEPDVDLRIGMRTSDSTAADRARALRRPPHLLVTTPESLYLLLTAARARASLRTVRTVIVDEIHALVPDRRGAHLALSLERLDALAGHPVARIGLSATARPLDEVAAFLVGTRRRDEAGRPRCAIVDASAPRALDARIELPDAPLQAVMSHEVWARVYDRIATLIGEHRSTLVFVPTRRLCERLARQLAERLGDDAVGAHHGALAATERTRTERRLAAGQLRAVVATATLELGIDVGPVDLVVQVGSPRWVSTFLQRAGRARHQVGGIPRTRLFPLCRTELVEAAALWLAIRNGWLEEVHAPPAPLDVLAQQIVAELASAGPATPDALFERVRGAWPYRALPRERFDAVVRMLCEGWIGRRGQRGALLFFDARDGVLRARRGARLTALTCGGVIVDSADYDVVLEPEGERIGTLNEDFAIESSAGDVFQLGNRSYQILRVEPGTVRVRDAQGAPPTVPFWLGEGPTRSETLSRAVRALYAELDRRLERPEAARAWLESLEVGPEAAAQLVDFLGASRAALGTLPADDRLVVERFFDERGCHHLVVHAPVGARRTRALGLALRKAFCRRFDFELQAAATDDAVLLSLGPTHSFPLDELPSMLGRHAAPRLLDQALLASPFFAVRWRGCAQRALAIRRFRNGRRVPVRFQRMDAEDLLALCFPDQLACAENLVGDRVIPDHPLVAQTMDDCRREATDAEGLLEWLDTLERGGMRLVARDLAEPSPLAAEALTARPYAFLDDAPLEERRTQAVMQRRWLDPQTAATLGALDPQAIARVCAEAWPDPRDLHEAHEALARVGLLTECDVERLGWRGWLDRLREEGRATRLDVDGGRWVALERMAEVRLVHREVRAEPPLEPPDAVPRPHDEAAALRELVRSRAELEGPFTTEWMAQLLGVPPPAVLDALGALEAEGSLMRGRFRPGARETEWCDRVLLARIHRATVERLRAEIEPIEPRDLVRFLFVWQRVDSETRLQGPHGLHAAIALLEGFEAPAAAWEADLLPARVQDYSPAWLDAACLSGHVAWMRRTPSEATVPLRAMPLCVLPRAAVAMWRSGNEAASTASISAPARRVADVLANRGATFFADLARDCAMPVADVERALAELVARGLCASDGFAGLRALLAPRRRQRAGRPARATPSCLDMASAGRWFLFDAPAESPDPEPLVRVWLRRWGVLTYAIGRLEPYAPPWRLLLPVLRRLEARGDVRGGRFVARVGGEQFALPEAVDTLRSVRRRAASGALVAVSGADPLNVSGVLVEGPRVARLAHHRVLFRDGVPVAVREGRRTILLVEADEADAWRLQRALARPLAPEVRAYLGSGA
ncbi:MAG: DEAD/DEAH box helicase [Myxococcota bacterium]|nr:DEAD/DEAH box helicase [Myxococcota bacterium]MDW8362898.1 DEAD/DEAH box helicase [Myxococcales bacterium]